MRRSMATVHGTASWDRASHAGTTVTAAGEVVLARAPAPTPNPAGGDVLPPDRSTLALDQSCHLYRTDPVEGVVERYLLGRGDGSRVSVAKRLPNWLDDRTTTVGDGAFVARGGAAGFGPAAVAADSDGRVWIADRDSSEIVVYDRWSQRVIQRRSVGDRVGGQARRVLDLAASEAEVFAVCSNPPGVVRLAVGTENREFDPRNPADPNPTPPDAEPVRATARAGRVAVLYMRPQPADRARRPVEGWVVSPGVATLWVDVATDLELLDVDRTGAPTWSLFVAGRPDGLVTQFGLGGDAWRLEQQLGARGYDGSSIVGLPDGSIAFWTDRGLHRPLAGRGRLQTRGRVTTLALDSRDFGSRWGRIFLDACMPRGTSIHLHCATSDVEQHDDESASAPPPSLGRSGPLVPGGPPRVPTHLAPGPDDVAFSVHRRAAGRPEPWSRGEDELVTYEAPVIAPPGRYLWLTVELAGTGSATPGIRTVKVERTTHGHLGRLPRVYARDDRAAFVDRYLSILTGVVDDLDDAAQVRHVLLDPRSVPDEALPWLASFVGLVLDDRWPMARRRRLVAEATALLSHRGTVWSLSRMLGILLGVEPIIIEHFRLHGVGAAVLSSDLPTSTSVLGAGFRVGGGLDEPDRTSLDDDAPADHAHRFSVLVPRHLGPDELDAVEHVLETHRPAHTMFDVCALGVGMRVGRGLHLELSSLVGPTGDWSEAWTGHWHLGRDTIVGHVGSPRLPVPLDRAGRLR